MVKPVVPPRIVPRGGIGLLPLWLPRVRPPVQHEEKPDADADGDAVDDGEAHVRFRSFATGAMP